MTKLTNEAEQILEAYRINAIYAATMSPVENPQSYEDTVKSRDAAEAEILQRMAEGAAGEASSQAGYRFNPSEQHIVDEAAKDGASVCEILCNYSYCTTQLNKWNVSKFDRSGERLSLYGRMMELHEPAPESGSASTAGPRPVTPRCPKCGEANFHRAVQTVRCFGCLADFDVEGVAVKEQVHRSSLLHRPNDPLPEGCYCKPGQCMAPVMMGRQMPCRDPEKAEGKTRCCDNGYFGEAHDCQKSNPEAAKS